MDTSQVVEGTWAAVLLAGAGTQPRGSILGDGLLSCYDLGMQYPSSPQPSPSRSSRLATLAIGWLITCVGFSVAEAAPQNPAGSSSASIRDESFEDAVEVRVVEVEVWVQSRNGEPVTGLGREDFELVVDGDSQDIEYFETAQG